MFRIDKGKNEITALKPQKFSELGFKERNHLQEWIAQEPSCLGEDLLIIQKEFAGFEDTNERLDLLALDKDGSLVIIENKLDDSGRDVTWQALKYASYCSGFSKKDIEEIYQEFLDKKKQGGNAQENLKAFFEEQDYEEMTLNRGITQRIILIAANFRKEVTSTVLWLTNFNLRLQCFEVTLYSKSDELFLTFEQIFPTKGAEEYTIGLAEKAREEAQQEAKIYRVYRRFWTELLAEMNKQTALFQNTPPRKYAWMGVRSDINGVRLNFCATKELCRAEIYIERNNKEKNKFIFDWLLERKDEIEATFGGKLQWDRLEKRTYCPYMIKSEIEADVSDEEQWDDMIKFMTDAMLRMEKAFKKPLAELKNELSNQT